MNRFCPVFLSTLCVIVAASCAAPQAPKTLDEVLADWGYRLGEPVDRIRNYTINGWNYLDRKHIVLLDRASGRYLVTFRQTCNGLASNELVAHSSTVNQLTKFDRFTLRDVTGRGVEVCWIEALHRLEKTR